MTEESYHFIGIGGIGMSALAHFLLQKGVSVSGSDVASSAMIEELKRLGANITIGHAASNVAHPTAVVYSTAVTDENPEVLSAKFQGVPLLHRSELLDHLMQGYQPLLVTGTHGKTTTSSLLAHLLVCAKLDPAYALGGIVGSLGSHGGHGEGNWFVAEADESDGSFLRYSPFGAIITNIDNDHLDYWGSFEKMVEGYRQFIAKVASPELLFYCGDDDVLCSLKPIGYSYGFEKGNDVFIKNFFQEGWKNVFDFSFEGIDYNGVEIPLIGAHNVLNSAAVFGMGLRLEIPEERIRNAFRSFPGISRRSELKGEKKGISVLDDYGHHPTEIFATLRAIKQASPHRRLVVAFQPHRYTRTRDCITEFGPAFHPADRLVLTDIYSAGEPPIEGVTHEALIAKLKDTAAVDVRYIPRQELSKSLTALLEPNDVLVTMGAGDITKVGPEVLQLLCGMHEN